MAAFLGLFLHLHHRLASTMGSITDNWGRGDLVLVIQSLPAVKS